LIVFNITAAICGFFIAVLLMGLHSLVPHMSEPMGYFSTAIIFLAVGWVAEFADLKPRVFWIPLYIWGVVLFLLGALIHGGPMVFWPLLAVGAIAFYFYRKRAAARAAQIALENPPQRDLRL
jgi:hypothetical protein